MYGQLYLMLFQMQAKFTTDAFFWNMFSHIINKLQVEAKKAIMITTRSTRNKISFQLYDTDIEKFLKSSVPEWTIQFPYFKRVVV